MTLAVEKSRNLDESKEELPQGWIWTSTGALCNCIVPNRDKPKTFSGDIPWITLPDFRDTTISIHNSKSGLGLSKEEIVKYKAKIIPKGSVIMSCVGRFGIAAELTQDAVVNQQLHAFLIPHALNAKYLAYHIKTQASYMESIATSTTISYLNKENCNSIPVPLAPINEQNRIVSEIEKQLTRLDAGVASLKRAQANLKRYKASVLKAACEGKLVPQDPSDEPASVLMERILAERRAKWETDLRAKGKDPTKVKYEPPAAPDTSELPELPQGWAWTKLNIVCKKIQDGTHFSPQKQYNQPGEGRVMYITAKNIRENGLDLSDISYIDKSFHESIYKRCNPEKGDVLLTKDGVKTGVVIINPLEEEFTLLSSVALLKTDKSILQSYFLKYYLSSPFGFNRITEAMTGTAIKRIVLNKIQVAPIPIPPLAEQERIITEVEMRLSVIQNLESTIKVNLKRAERMRQSILKKAFVGKLVLQNPSDEPASVLLARIRAEREAQEGKGGGKKNGAKQMWMEEL